MLHHPILDPHTTPLRSLHATAPYSLTQTKAHGQWSRFLRMQVFAQDKLLGNMNIVTGVRLFVGGIFIVHRSGELFVPV
ncbi:hypothetical protein EI94DRAFT_1586198 [Lactarius quietus]|nr:hypothetical protein EI94DRAFT_1586198 [Lactarius quietus]